MNRNEAEIGETVKSDNNQHQELTSEDGKLSLRERAKNHPLITLASIGGSCIAATAAVLIFLSDRQLSLIKQEHAINMQQIEQNYNGNLEELLKINEEMRDAKCVVLDVVLKDQYREVENRFAGITWIMDISKSDKIVADVKRLMDQYQPLARDCSKEQKSGLTQLECLYYGMDRVAYPVKSGRSTCGTRRDRG